MNTLTKAAGVVAGVSVVVRELEKRRSGGADPDTNNRWRAVTVNRPRDEVVPDGRLPQPLRDLGDTIEVQVRAAPGGKGTEIAARLRSPEPSGVAGVVSRIKGDDPRQAVRAALRESKQLLEVGEVLQVEPQPAGHRPPTPGGRALEAVTKRAGREGVL